MLRDRLYDSHPEIAVKNAWTPQRLRKEFQRLRDAGLEPIPKLNFSAGHDKPVATYVELEKRGYDQVPTLSNWHTPDNIARTVEFCRKHVAPERLKGFLLAPWRPTLFETRQRHLAAIEHFGKAIAGDRAGR